MGDHHVTLSLPSDLSFKFLSPMNFSQLKRSNARRLLVKQFICETAVGFLYAANAHEVHF